MSMRSKPRLTRDIDLVVAVDTEEEAEALIRSLRDAGLFPATVLEHGPTNRLSTVRLSRTADLIGDILIDLLFASCGIEKEVVSSAEDLEILPGVIMPVAQRSHLLAMKLLAVDERRRPKDAEDILNLIKSSSEKELGLTSELLSLITSRNYHRERDLPQIFQDFISRSLE